MLYEVITIKGPQEKPLGSEVIPGCIRDAAPDAWGRRVILNKLLGLKGQNADTAELDEFTYLIESGSDRIGGLDFQKSPRITSYNVCYTKLLRIFNANTHNKVRPSHNIIDLCFVCTRELMFRIIIIHKLSLSLFI